VKRTPIFRAATSVLLLSLACTPGDVAEDSPAEPPPEPINPQLPAVLARELGRRSPRGVVGQSLRSRDPSDAHRALRGIARPERGPGPGENTS